MQVDVNMGTFKIARLAEVARFHQESCLRGIFVLEKHAADKKKDKLKWCFAMPGDPRPTEFSAAHGSNHKLIELERYDETEAITTILISNGRTERDSRGWVDSVVLKTPTEEALASLKDLRRLNSITLGVANEDVAKHLSGHPTLKNLRLDCETRAEIIGKLTEQLPRLETLEFSCAEFTAAYAKEIAKSKTLKTLFLFKRNLEEGNRHLAAMPNLDLELRTFRRSERRGFGGGGVGGNF